MSARLRRLLLPLLRAAAKGGVITFRMRSAAQQGLFLLQKATPKSKGGRLRRIQKRTAHNQTTAWIREAVVSRASSCCENCGRGFVDAGLEMDHWLGGVGRRREKQAVSNCWVLCPECHNQRTHYLPSVAYWNERFALFAARHGYGPEPKITHAQLKRSAP